MVLQHLTALSAWKDRLRDTHSSRGGISSAKWFSAKQSKLPCTAPKCGQGQNGNRSEVRIQSGWGYSYMKVNAPPQTGEVLVPDAGMNSGSWQCSALRGIGPLSVSIFGTHPNSCLPRRGRGRLPSEEVKISNDFKRRMGCWKAENLGQLLTVSPASRAAPGMSQAPLNIC